ncbi:MAG: phosphodiesterase [Oscillospiraceae bacterium]|nr:phosphodiesterase [Oscillospiraceae bacterium]
MKLMIASDIHGSAYYCRELIERFRLEKPEKLILLGDILYHGPRNALPKDYNPAEVAEMLNEIKDSILAIRGNCDSEVDQMMLHFPILSDSALVYFEGREFYLTHGHNDGETNPPPITKGTILLCGHTHVPKCQNYDGYIYVNPGSVSIPKEDSPHSYIVIEDSTIIWKDINGNVYMRREL